MRIIQIIDSLEAGGAERIAVSYANALAKKIEFSGLVATRKEGPLLNQMEQNVSYLFLNKKGTIDLRAIFRLRRYVTENKVTIIHAHSTSYFLAFLLKLTHPSIQLIWHDHYGNSEFLSKRPSTALRISVPFFNGVIAVNQNLKKWSEKILKCKNVLFLPNFASSEKTVAQNTTLNGTTDKRILLLANLRIQKNHFLLLDVAKMLKVSHPEWSFHLVGKDFEDEYSKKIKDLIIDFDLEKNVFLYGAKEDIGTIMQQSTIGILTSDSEGLPISLLEYSLYKKPVVVTNVGDISSLFKNGKSGFIVEAKQTESFYDSLVKLILNENLRNDFGLALHDKVAANNSKEAVIKQYLSWLENNYR